MAVTGVRSRANNMPAELTSFVGRRRELGELKRLLGRGRLVTLTGAGGAGKTRLALRAAAELSRSFPDGVWLVSLASIDDPQLVIQAVFGALGLQDMSGGWSLSKLNAYLAAKHLLLVLDNCEHLLDSCALLAVTLLKACPRLRVLATSRQALGTPGETRLRVPPLSLPEDGERLTPEQLAGYEAVALLRERAIAVLPGFKVDRANAAAVLRLCRRLDGMPLALELAAVRLEGLSVEQVVSGLEGELPVLGRGSRGVEARQQTLEATIGWSYGLLEEPERLLWARLSVFAGGFDAEVAATVCSDPDLPAGRIPVTLGSLVEKSIVQRDQESGPARYSMLETVRQFGRQRLRDLGQEFEVRRRHRDWISQLAREASAYDNRQPELFMRIRLELDNVWAALDFCRSEPGEVAAAAEACINLYYYWWSRGPIAEVRRFLGGLLPLTAPDTRARGLCLWTAASLALVQNDLDAAQAMIGESMRIARQIQDAELIADNSGALAFLAIYLKNKSEDELLSLADTVVAYGNSGGPPVYRVIGLGYRCVAKLISGDLDEAIQAGEEAVAICRNAGEVWVKGQVLNNLAEAWRRRGDPERAEALAREGVAGKHAVGDRRGTALHVETLAWLAADRGAHERAAVLLGYAQQLRESIMVALLPGHRERHHVSEQAARGALGESAFSRAVERGMTMRDDDAIAFVLEHEPAATAMRPATSAPAEPKTALTRRELEIARLIAEGLTSRQIAGKLFISERTVTTHVTNILNKLGLSSRIQLAAWVTANTTA